MASRCRLRTNRHQFPTPSYEHERRRSTQLHCSREPQLSRHSDGCQPCKGDTWQACADATRWRGDVFPWDGPRVSWFVESGKVFEVSWDEVSAFIYLLYFSACIRPFFLICICFPLYFELKWVADWFCLVSRGTLWKHHRRCSRTGTYFPWFWFRFGCWPLSRVLGVGSRKSCARCHLIIKQRNPSRMSWSISSSKGVKAVITCGLYLIVVFGGCVMQPVHQCGVVLSSPRILCHVRYESSYRPGYENFCNHEHVINH